MWGFDTNDEKAVALQVEVLLFDIETDPEGQYAGELVQERAYVAPTSAQVEMTIPTPAGTVKLVPGCLLQAESRSELRLILAGLLARRAGVEQPEARAALRSYTEDGFRRYVELMDRDGN